MNEEVKLQSKQRVLQKMRVVAMQIAAAEFVDRNMDLDIIEDYMAHNLLYRLHSYVLAEDLGTREYEVQFSRPLTWWQHFKQGTWIGRKIGRYRPVRIQVVTKKVIGHGYRGYPNAPIALPEDRMGQAVVFETFEMDS